MSKIVFVTESDTSGCTPELKETLTQLFKADSYLLCSDIKCLMKTMEKVTTVICFRDSPVGYRTVVDMAKRAWSVPKVICVDIKGRKARTAYKDSITNWVPIRDIPYALSNQLTIDMRRNNLENWMFGVMGCLLLVLLITVYLGSMENAVASGSPETNQQTYSKTIDGK